MKYLIAIVFLILIAASFLVWASLPDVRSDVPVIYWVTDANPARMDQVRLFQQWLKDNGYPPMQLKLDMANAERTKKIIQGVSGVAGDVMDIGSGGDMRYFRAMGLNEDVTEAAEALGFDLSHTYSTIADEIAMEDDLGRTRQYQFPCNVSANMYIANRQTFRQHNQPPPPRRWTVEEFERRGKAFVEAANAGRSRRTVFFVDTLPSDIVRASFGGSAYNETTTRCTLDDEPNIRTLELMWKWRFVDRLIPRAADVSSFTVEGGSVGRLGQLLSSEDPEQGQYAMIWMGRYGLIELRKHDARRKAEGRPLLDLSVVEPPHGGFPNTLIAVRGAGVYAGGRHKELAKYFLAFLASKEYNMQIVRDADALPPNPEYTKIEEYLRPAEYPNEWEVHGPFAEAAETIAIGRAYSPFILSTTAARLEGNATSKFMQERPLRGYETAEAAAIIAARDINREIQLTLKEHPRLRPLYDRLLQQQAWIDTKKQRLIELEAAGKPITAEDRIPMRWITNPFYRAYYKSKGWAE